jgi:hypothetical protein
MCDTDLFRNKQCPCFSAFCFRKTSCKPDTSVHLGHFIPIEQAACMTAVTSTEKKENVIFFVT